MTINQSSTGQALHDERLAVIASMRRCDLAPTPRVVDAVARIILTMKETNGPY